MNREDEKRKLWQKLLEKDREVQSLLADCKRQGRKTVAYENALKDCNKLRLEYAALEGGKAYDPHSLADVESAADRTARQYLGDR